jgi:ligand-binding sensor domain-containing protein
MILNNGLPATPLYIYSDPAGITWFVSKKGMSSLSNEYFKIYDLTNNSFNAMTIAIGTDKQNNL